jgi:acyl carrier protein
MHRSLPQHMIPSELVQLESLPRTPNGKLDRRLLPDPKLSPVQNRPELIEPRTSVERELAAIWTELLQLPQVSMEDQFFKVGGHSLVASQIVSRIRELYDLEVPLSLFLQNPSIADLDRYITERMLESIDQDELQNLLQS